VKFRAIAKKTAKKSKVKNGPLFAPSQY